MRRLLAGLALSAAAVGTALAAQAPAEAWEIGPVIKGRNYSVGMPATLQPGRDGPWFAFPTQGEGHVHYVTLQGGALPDRGTVVLRYRIDAARGARFIAQDAPDQTATISLFFQRTGDNWTARGRYGDYRWYAPPATLMPVMPGEHTVRVRLDDPNWGNVNGQQARDQGDGFAQALANGGRAGFVFGSSSRRGHGVFATAPARFTLLDFRIE
jgi:hypothetical protein